MSANTLYDVLLVGGGPAGLALAAALGEQGLRVLGITPGGPESPWPNTYGIWEDELATLGLTHLLAQRWTDCVSYTDAGQIRHERVYGLIDNGRLQTHLLHRGSTAGTAWLAGSAAGISHEIGSSVLHLADGRQLQAGLVVDASGHRPVLLQRATPRRPIAFQAAYGIAGRFSRPPVDPDQMVLMDYRTGHLEPAERSEPPTFLYAMDLGDGRHFVEETSLAHAPAVSFETLERRLHRRLSASGIEILATEHVEHCLFPMNLPLPDLNAPLLGYGGAASLVHPASGYQVGSALRRAEGVARAMAAALDRPDASPAAAARAGWQALWPADRLRKRALYLFGLENVMRFDNRQTQAFFSTFFALPYPRWSGYLSDTLDTAELVATMLLLFGRAPWHVQRSLAGSILTQSPFLGQAVTGRAH